MTARCRFCGSDKLARIPLEPTCHECFNILIWAEDRLLLAVFDEDMVEYGYCSMCFNSGWSYTGLCPHCAEEGHGWYWWPVDEGVLLIQNEVPA